jgi:hypothetical protein
MEREGDTINTVCVAIYSFDQIARKSIPHPYTLIERSSRNQIAFRRYRYTCDTIFNAQGDTILTGIHVPHSHSTINTTRHKISTITRDVHRANFLLMAIEFLSDNMICDIPNLLSAISMSVTTKKSREYILTLTSLSSAPVIRYLPLGLKHMLRM